jgi:hypothetical protein
MVKTARAGVDLDLCIPSVSDELFKPDLELSKFFARKAANGGLEFLEAHGKEQIA